MSLPFLFSQKCHSYEHCFCKEQQYFCICRFLAFLTHVQRHQTKSDLNATLSWKIAKLRQLILLCLLWISHSTVITQLRALNKSCLKAVVIESLACVHILCMCLSGVSFCLKCLLCSMSWLTVLTTALLNYMLRKPKQHSLRSFRTDNGHVLVWAESAAVIAVSVGCCPSASAEVDPQVKSGESCHGYVSISLETLQESVT